MLARQSPFSPLTLSRLRSVSGEYRWLNSVPPFVIHCVVGSALSCAALNAGAGLMTGLEGLSAACPGLAMLAATIHDALTQTRTQPRIGPPPRHPAPASDTLARMRVFSRRAFLGTSLV